VSRGKPGEIADRRALLATRAELDRTRVTLCIHEVKAIIIPPPDRARAAAWRPTISMLVGLAAPVVGVSRLGRWLRIASWTLAAWRVARNWRSTR
jgi:hypothetical protein